MKKSQRLIVFTLLLGALLLSACSGAVPSQVDSSQAPSGSQFTEVVFTGSVESMGGGQWLISGQQVGVDDSTSVDPGIQAGDIVRVEANVSPDGVVLALRIESSRPDDVGANDNAVNGNDSNTNDGTSNTNDNANGNANDNSNTGNDNGNTNGNSNDNSNGSDDEQEIYGVVEAITTDSITIDGVTYSFADFTKINDLIAVGDEVKIQFIVNADGTFTAREIESSPGNAGNDNGNSNSNDNGSDDDNSNSNSNDDDGDNSNSNSNGNDDDSDDDSNDNDSNSNGG